MASRTTRRVGMGTGPMTDTEPTAGTCTFQCPYGIKAHGEYGQAIGHRFTARAAAPDLQTLAAEITKDWNDRPCAACGAPRDIDPLAVRDAVPDNDNAGSRVGLNHRPETAGLTPYRDASDGLELRDAPSASDRGPDSDAS